MASGSLDYAENHTYEIEQATDNSRSAGTIGVLHRIRGNNLVSELLMQKKAHFACTIVSPTSAFRRIEKAVEIPQQVGEGVQLEQQIEIISEQFAPPVMFQPSVITNTEVNQFTAKKSHGVDELWIGEKIEFPIAAIIAVQPFWSAKTMMQSILRLKKISDGSLNPGSFEVKDVTEEGFYFLVEVEESLFNCLRNPESFEHRDSIYSTALSQGLSILRDEVRYKERNYWIEQHNLKLLYQMLKERDIPTWDDDDFKPNQVAASFHPHRVKIAQDIEQI